MNIKNMTDAGRVFGMSGRAMKEIVRRNHWPCMRIARTLYVDVDEIRARMDNYIPPVTLEDISAATGLPRETLRKMCRGGQLTAKLVNGHIWRFESVDRTKDELKRMMEAYTDDAKGDTGITSERGRARPERKL